MGKSKLNLMDKTSFAFEVSPIPNGILLSICGAQYEAWNYDTYIYDALTIAGFWQDHERTYERIVHLRTWLRENVQHGHNIPVTAKSLNGAKKLIDNIIKSECPTSPPWEEERKFQLKHNAEVFA